MAKVIARWTLALDCECPKCLHDFDLVDIDDFWGNGIEACEHDTNKSKDFEVTCPECEHEFSVDFEY